MADGEEQFSSEVIDQRKHSHGRGRTWRRRRIAKNNQKRPHVLLESDYINLLKWAKQNGVVFDRIRPAIFNDTGRGMIATRNIKNCEDIISVPARLLITPQTALQSVLGNIYQSISKRRNVKLSKKCLLCMYVVYLRYLGRESFWFPYIKTLPNAFNTPCYFDEMELKLLPTSCYKKSLCQIDELKKAFESVQEIFGETLKDFDLNFSQELTYGTFRWAWFVVNTRSVYLKNSKEHPGYYGDCCHGDNYALAPVLDLLNHNDTADIHAGFDLNCKAYTITTVTEYHKGDQVFINYGPHDNTTLLIEYGFILPKNVHNSFKFDPSQVYSLLHLASVPAVNKKLQLVKRNDFEKDFSCSYDYGISWNLLTTLRILALKNNEIDQWTKVFNGNALSCDENLLVDQWLVLIVSSTLETLVKEDEQLTIDSVLNTNMNLSLELRKQDKEIVKKVLSQLEKANS